MAADLAASIDETWTMFAGILVMFMQAGFAMLEAGIVQDKNTQGIFVKNLMDACIGALSWFLVGYGLAFGEDSGKFIGTNLFGGQNSEFENAHYVSWFFQWAFCATAATIVSGAVAERINLMGYICFMIVLTSFVYPVVVHWTWGGGWLSDGEDGIYTDFAGSGIVHMTGGVAALCGAVIVGPRTGRFDPAKAADWAPHNVPMVILGTLILWFGWYGFNCGSTTAMSGGASNTAALVAMTTTLSAASGGMTVFLGRMLASRTHDVCGLANGILAGLVSITAGCDGVYGWAAVCIGFIGGLVYLGISRLLTKLQIDDPVDAFAIHGACGAWGVIAVAFFNFNQGILYGGEDAGKLLQWQVIGILAIFAWVASISCVVCTVLHIAGVLRLSLEEEELGSNPPSPLRKQFEFACEMVRQLSPKSPTSSSSHKKDMGEASKNQKAETNVF